MGELEDRINSVLGDPAQLAQIRALAQSLMGGDAAPTSTRDDIPTLSLGGDSSASLEKTASLDKIGALLRGGFGAKSPRLAALEALGPCLDAKRREKLARAIRLARVLRLAQAGLPGAEGKDV